MLCKEEVTTINYVRGARQVDVEVILNYMQGQGRDALRNGGGVLTRSEGAADAK